jgi:hypothetical protein
MPIKGGKLTPQERLFAKHYAESGSGVFAAEKAGYAQSGASASKNLAKPAVVEEARRIALDFMAREIIPAATKRHLKILQDDNTPPGAHNKAIEIAYKYGLVDRAEISDKAPSELSAAEISVQLAGLEAVKQRLLREASDRANPIIEASVLD